MTIEGTDGKAAPSAGAAARRLDVADWTERALDQLGSLAGVDRVGLALVEGGGRRLLFTSSDSAASDRDWCQIDAFDDVPLNDALGSGTKLVGSMNDLGPRYASFARNQLEAGFAAAAAVPLTDGGRVLGGFILYYARPQPFEVDQCAELDEVADDLAGRLHAALRRPGPSLPEHRPSPDGMVAAQQFPADLASVPASRRFLFEALDAWGVDDDTAGTAALCLSELVTNALVHAHGGCYVRVERRDDILRVEVHDAGPGPLLPVPADREQHRLHGRGLQIVEALASDWGQSDEPDRAAVWFCLDLSELDAGDSAGGSVEVGA